MLEKQAKVFVDIGKILEKRINNLPAGKFWRGSTEPVWPGDSIGSNEFDSLRDDLTELQRLCTELEAPIAAALTMRASLDLAQQSNWIHVSEKFGELERAFDAEVASKGLLYVSTERKRYYSDEAPFGREVNEAFPSAAFDVSEASKCLALDRDTASVFHSMRTLEIGLKTVARDLGVSFEHRNWENIIGDVEKAIAEFTSKKTKPAHWKKGEKHYADLAKEFRYVKNAWRNHVMHVRDKYTPEEALTVFRHVREFMNGMVEAGLHQDPESAPSEEDDEIAR